MKKQSLVVLFLFAINFVLAQKQELGKVTLEELSQKRHKIDTSAVASIIFSRGLSYIEYIQGEGFKAVTDVETKIKVYKKDGFSYGDYSVNYYKTSQAEQLVSFAKAVTYNLENGIIVKSKLKSENEFKEIISETRAVKKIAMPNVKEGSIIEYKYTIRSPAGYIASLPEWNFQREIPVDYSEFTTRIPQYYTYNKFLKGFLQVKETSMIYNKSMLLNYKGAVSANGLYRNQNYAEPVNYQETETIHQISNVPALKQEGYVNNIDNYRASIQYELAKSEFVGSTTTLYATSWEAVAKKIYEDDDFGLQLNKNNYFEDDLKAVIANAGNDSQKTMTIFNYVKNRMAWDQNYGYYCKKGVKNAYKEKTGNVADINLMLTAMLRFAGLNSNPILVSTRGNGIALFPSRNAYDYVISSVNLGDDNVILLDATNKYSMPDLLPARDLNWFGRMITKEGLTEEIDLALKVVSTDDIRFFVKMDANGDISGKLRETYFDYNGFLFRDNYAAMSQDNYLEMVEKRFPGLEISNYVRTNETDFDKPLTESFDVKIKNSVESIGNKLYFSPMLVFAEQTNPFTQETREYPVDFTFPHQDKYIIIAQIPDGYTVESVPIDETFVLGNDMGSFTYGVTTTDNQIQVVIVLSINTSIVAASDYADLKLFYKNHIAKQNEKIVLKKV